MAQIADLAPDGSHARFMGVLPPLPQVDRTTVARLHFGSLAELVAMVPAKAPPDAKEEIAKFWNSKDKDFYGCSMAQARRFAAEGWQEGAERAQPLIERVKLARPTKKTLALGRGRGGAECAPPPVR